MKTNVHVIISGRVQGVWFRASAKQTAEQLGLTGWVRNTADGNVEAIFEGEEDIVKEMIDWCHCGPILNISFCLAFPEHFLTFYIVMMIILGLMTYEIE